MREALKAADGKYLTWHQDHEEIFAIIRNLYPINQEEIRRIFGMFNGIAYRAMQHSDGGHYDVRTLEVSDAERKDSSSEVTVLKIRCTPSMKNVFYWVHLVFSKDV